MIVTVTGMAKQADEEKIKDSDIKEVNILCFGDSLTRGYLNYGMVHIPYSTTLQDLIEKDYAQSIKLKIIESGVDGELVTNTMLDRVTNILKQNSFDIVVFLGGTNDIGWGKSVKDICDSYTKIYDTVIKTYKCQLIVVTVPPCLHSFKQVDDKRNKLNDFIQKQQNVVDLFEFIDQMKDQQKKQFFDNDGIHFSETGYAKFGNLVYDKLKGLLDQMISNK